MLTYATVFDYLLSLATRFSPIGRAALTLTGEAGEGAEYPLVLLEADAPGQELLDGARPTGVETFTMALQVLTRTPDATLADLVGMLAQTNGWADALTEQLRKEHPGLVASVHKLPLPGVAGTDLATGWRVEVSLKLCKEIDRNANSALFAPQTPA